MAISIERFLYVVGTAVKLLTWLRTSDCYVDILQIVVRESKRLFQAPDLRNFISAVTHEIFWTFGTGKRSTSTVCIDLSHGFNELD